MPSALPTGLHASRPRIFMGGSEQPTLSGGLLSMMIGEHLSGLYRCEIKFGNWGPVNNNIDFLYFDRQLLDFGKDLQIKLDDEVLFTGKVTGLEAEFPEAQPPTITVLAEDQFQDLRMTRRTRTFSDVSDADVVNQIATEYGLSANVHADGPIYKILAQVNQSDLAFLRERARTIDAELWLDGRTLNVSSRANRNGGTLQMRYGSELREFCVCADLAIQRTSVTVSGWDVSSKSGVRYEATESAISNEIQNDASGVGILQSAFGQRKETLAHTVPFNSQEAQAAAESYFKMSARRFLTGRGVVETQAGLHVGSFVELQGLGSLFSGRYYLVDVVHLFDGKHGLRSEFRVERPGIGRS